MTIDNAWDEKWSEWVEYMGGGQPVPDNTVVQLKYEKDEYPLNPDGNRACNYSWGEGRHQGCYAYRYKIKEPESTMTPEEEEIPTPEWTGSVPDGVMTHDNVNKPKHYQLREGYEVYDLRQDLAAKAANGGATYDQYSDWDRAIEYIIRMWGKNKLEDAKKGRWYLDKLISKLEAE